MEIVIYRRQKVDYGEQSDTTCLVPNFACCVAVPSEFLYNDFQVNVQELRLQARFFKGLGKNLLQLALCEENPPVAQRVCNGKSVFS